MRGYLRIFFGNRNQLDVMESKFRYDEKEQEVS